jgi:hypothetical protein
MGSEWGGDAMLDFPGLITGALNSREPTVRSDRRKRQRKGPPAEGHPKLEN